MSTSEELINALNHGEIELKGQFNLGSNYTFLVNVHHNEEKYQAVYKPSEGEQPLWDFPENTLALREVAAYHVSEALGWHIVPLTILRTTGPYGAGSLQQYIKYDPQYHYFSFNETDKARLNTVALFDLLTNNADRKGSHVFFEKRTRDLYAIDHGLCFHVEDKLRTVIWDFANQNIDDTLLADLKKFHTLLTTAQLNPVLGALLSPEEISALAKRAQALTEAGVYPPQPKDRRSFPYPPL